jgi:hypothetical protein
MAISGTTEKAWVDGLRRRLAGRLITPGDEDYDSARVVMVGHVDRHPDAIARVANAGDVATVMWQQ